MSEPALGSVRLSNLDRVLWPAAGFTKGDLVDYYRRIGPVLVPHLVGRPLMLGRWPEGIDRRGWGQWECRGRPVWMHSAPLAMRNGTTVDVCLVDDLRSLLWVANQGVIELHPYLGRADSFAEPTAAVFDLDPGPPAGLLDCCVVALRLREVLSDFGLECVAKTSGGAGLHVFVPLNTAASYAHTKRFARDLARRLAEAEPDAVTHRARKDERAGRVFIDWAQNDERKQTVSVYSLRAMPRPTVSAPVHWSEIEDAVAAGNAGRLQLTPAQVLERAASFGDLFRPALELRQAIPGST